MGRGFPAFTTATFTPFFLCASSSSLFGHTISLSQKDTDPLKQESKRREFEAKEVEKRNQKIDKVIKTIWSYYGTPFKEKGTSKKGVDAVGLAYKSYKSVGIKLPLNLEALSESGKRKYIGEIEKGDLLFFAISSGDKKLYSVGIVNKIEYGDVYFVQCTSVGGVKEYKLNDPKWKDRYILARRIIKK